MHVKAGKVPTNPVVWEISKKLLSQRKDRKKKVRKDRKKEASFPGALWEHPGPPFIMLSIPPAFP